MNATWLKHKDLEAQKAKKPIPTQPIPFFGDIKKATVLTVGVNPSAREFGNKRDWPKNGMAADKLKDRLQRYFRCDSDLPPPYFWFDIWEEALELLGVSYKDGAAHLAAHLDLSPRVTASMGGANRDAFLTMMKEDTKWFFKLLPECKAARLILIAGSVTGRYYMDEFMECVAYRYGYKLEKPPTPRGEGFGFNRLIGDAVDVPMFFCSVSPSNTQRRLLLIQCIKDNQEELRKYINKPLVKC